MKEAKDGSATAGEIATVCCTIWILSCWQIFQILMELGTVGSANFEEKDQENVDREEVVLDEEGDVILELQDADVKVSSILLAKISPVFRAMFVPGFSEGSQLSVSSPSRINLPDDDTEAMTILCRAIYHGLGYAFDSFEPRMLFFATRLADKYGCLKVLNWPMKCYLVYDFLETSTIGIVYDYLLYPFLKFGDDEMPQRTLPYILYYSHLPLTPLPNDLAEALPDHWPELLLKASTRLKLSVTAQLPSILRKHTHSKCRAGHSITSPVSDGFNHFVLDLGTGSIAETMGDYVQLDYWCLGCEDRFKELIVRDVIDSGSSVICFACLGIGDMHTRETDCVEVVQRLDRQGDY